MQKLPSRQLIPPEEEKLIELLLQDVNESSKKAGLKRLCNLYQTGRRLSSANKIGLLVRALLFEGDEEVERWALKAVAELKNHRQHLHALREKLKKPSNNYENRTWEIAALFAIADEKTAREIFEESGLDKEFDDAMVLAASMYPKAFLNEKLFGKTIDIEAAGVITLKWSCLLFGLQKVRENLFHPRHCNVEMVSSLARHDASIVAQYSMWALTENPTCGAADLNFSYREIEAFPPNVRRWGYQLTTKDGVSENTFDLLDMGRHDSSSIAREGLAIGLGEVWADGLGEPVVDWLSVETDEKTKSALLAHMARYSEECSAYWNLTRDAFLKAERGGLLRTQLEVASSGTSLFGEFKRIQIEDSKEMDLFHPEVRGSTISINNNYGAVTMGNSQNINSGGGEINIGGNVVGGDIKYSDIQSKIEQVDGGKEEVTLILLEVLNFLREGGLEKKEEQELAKQLSDVAESPSQSKFEGLLGVLKNISVASAYSGSILENAHALYDKVAHLVGSL
ncbi:hypothetical protein [Parvibaculum sp. MBR-TMA-1.3b-4.2]|jgi:hypothetical protein